MRSPARRSTATFTLEALEPRTLLSVNPATSILVRPTPGASAATTQALYSALGAHVVESFPDGPTVLTLNSGVDRDAVLGRLRSSSLFQYAEPDGTLQVTDTIPNDPMFSQQWGLNNGNDVDINAPQAWDVTRGNPSTIVAVLDSGIDVNHIDFVGRLWTNPADGSHGWNFIANNTRIQDDNGHGSHVAGIIGAAGNNGAGVAGVNWYAQLMPLKIIAANGDGSTDAAISAIYWAVQHGARVINASWDGPDFSQALDDAIRYAGSQNVVFVVAAGNEAANNDVVPSYPANDRLPNEISVAAVDASGALASFSNYGATKVDLASPGVNIVSTVSGGYASYSGTSMAAPFVAGVAALVIGQNPNLTAPEVVHQILSTVKPLPSLAGKTVTGGMVDAARAVGMSVSAVNYQQGIDKSALTLDRPSTGQWSSYNTNTGALQSLPFGAPNLDVAVPGDYDGTGRLQYAVFRTTTAEWFIQGPGGGRMIQFGAPSDIPMPGDYDGDGKTDIAVFRRSTATWYVLGTSTGPWARQFGAPGLDLAVPADYDGDGKADLAVFRPTTDQWFILQSTVGPKGIQFGPAGQAFPVPTDFDGDGQADIAVYQPSTSQWYILGSTDGFQAVHFGIPGQSIPVPADYDGDGKADVAVYQPSLGEWYLLRSSAGPLAKQFGMPFHDTPLTAPIAYRLPAAGMASQGRSVRAASVAPAVTRSAATGSPGSDSAPAVLVAELPSKPSSGSAFPVPSRSRRHAHAWDAALEGAVREREALRET
jgi:subtilisin family serine protease